MTRDWTSIYSDMSARLGRLASDARPTLCGFNVCVDRMMNLHGVAEDLLSCGSYAGVALGQELVRRASSGIGGEIRLDWAEGPAFLDPRGSAWLGCGGTSAQAANMLAMLGAPAFLALADRSERQLSVVHPDVLVAEEGRTVRSRDAHRSGKGKIPHYIFDYTKGVPVAGKTPPRSTRVIVRFADEGLEHDSCFAEMSRRLAGSAGSGILSGFNGSSASGLARDIEMALAVTADWLRAGMETVHFELGDFPDPEIRKKSLEALRGSFTSFGLSSNELEILLPGKGDVVGKAQLLAGRYGLQRVSVHADEWAMSLTRGDPQAEFDALVAGCLLSASRAAAGKQVVPSAPPAAARYVDPPDWPHAPLGDGWSVVACASPYLEHPVSTVGLGDTFVAGTLLVLGQPSARKGHLSATSCNT